MKIENVKIQDLKCYKLNSKAHPQKQIEGLAESIRRFGFTQPIVVDSKNEIIIGHGRLAGANIAGLKEVPVLRMENLSESEVRTLRIMDNRISETGWNNEILIEDLKTLDADFSAFNIDFDFLADDLLDEPKQGLTDEDAVPESAPPVVQLGQIWKLGNHRLMCGDSTKIEDVEKLMDGNKADMVFTDPPFGVCEKGNRKENGRSNATSANNFDNIIGDDSENTAKKVFQLAQIIADKIVYWGANNYSFLPVSRGWIIWDKRENKGVDDNGDAELAWTNINKPIRTFYHLWKGMIKASERQEKRVHPTQKPIALAEWVFKEYSNDAKAVLDLFGGSGSTLIACEKTNRKCFMMELDPKYCDVIIKRWQDFTGQKAELLSEKVAS